MVFFFFLQVKHSHKMPSAVQQQSKQKTATAQESLVLVRNMMRTSVSTVAYLRGVFPDEAFGDRRVSGLNVKTLLPNCEDSRTVCDWLEKGVFDALQKQYLRVMSLVILDGSNEVLENYDFRVKYPDGNSTEIRITTSSGSESQQTQHNPQSREEISRSVKLLLRKLVTLTQAMADLPPEFTVTMRLIFDPSTPSEYQPPYFQEASDKAKKQVLHRDKNRLDVNMGSFSTDYHMMDLRCIASEKWLDSQAPTEESTTTEYTIVKDVSINGENNFVYLALLSGICEGMIVTSCGVGRQLGFSVRKSKHIINQLEAWGFVTTSGSITMTKQCIEGIQLGLSELKSELSDCQKESIRDALLSASDQPTNVSNAPRPRKRQGETLSQSQTPPSSQNLSQSLTSWYGDEPKISAIEKPKHFKQVQNASLGRSTAS